MSKIWVQLALKMLNFSAESVQRSRQDFFLRASEIRKFFAERLTKHAILYANPGTFETRFQWLVVVLGRIMC